MNIRQILIIAITATVFSLNALACGDNLFRVGKGVSHRVYTAPLPGSVLVYGQSEGSKQLAEELAKSGHGVHMVHSEEELASELEKGGYDVVIAPYSQHEAVETKVKMSSASSTSFLPVAMNRDEQKQAKQSYNNVMLSEKDEIKHYLKAIHKTLKAKA